MYLRHCLTFVVFVHVKLPPKLMQKALITLHGATRGILKSLKSLAFILCCFGFCSEVDIRAKCQAQVPLFHLVLLF